MPEIDIDQIKKILPHRYPFLLVDRILECDLEGQRIVGLKNVTVNEPYFNGHFPGYPIMPGVLQVEAMAQVGGVLMNQLYNAQGRVAYFLSIDRARFRRAVRPGDQMRIEVVLIKARLKVCRFKAVITVADEEASSAELMFTYREEANGDG
ncbi:MAG: 3-hydroxyacyl-ACP dehydratase FabZ [Verrucomicrobia bacterium]|nr:3-hydroxyacyl-ACP dehydratase FabZ [Kiritimatiellia bacterium]MCB1100735.1 3-hydroxyacyl-ACP dehydratase FabZ [Kiritimatiellia bacterium]MCP5488819.1 3-hydroxyacyl-ACP dehydratase FabZ [Verrucomicrobiota bacterium]